MTGSEPSGTRSTGAQAGSAEVGGLEAADQAFHVLNAGTSRLVQLLADELVPLSPRTLTELDRTIEQIRQALPDLARWRAPTGAGGWTLEPPFHQAGVRIAEAADLADIENVERLRRSLDFLGPHSLALRKEPATLVADALLDLLRR